MINIFKKITVIARSSVKFIVLAILSIFFILAAIAYFYNPTYAVSLNGEVIGYTENKNQTCHRICHGRPGVTSGTDKSLARGKSRHDSKELYLKQGIAENKNNRLTKL